MKKIFLILSVLLAAVACQKPQYVLPTIERQGITSLTAYFTSGQYEDQQLAKLTITDPEADRYVIEVPWFFPEESENPTTIHMASLRIRAEIATNCKIDPPLTVLDLNRDNQFTFTDAQGKSRNIVITGQRVKSNKTELLSFSLTEPYPVDGFVDASEGIVYLFTTDDLSNFSADAVVCAHATISTDISKPKNYNNEQLLTVVAHDGVTKQTYKIVKKTPTKIPYGFNSGSERQLFNFDPVTRLGLPAYSETAYPSLGAIGGKLVVCTGSGTPIYLNGMTGVKEGNINLGSAVCNAVTSDEAGHLLIITHAEAGGTMSIYATSSVTSAPTLFYQYENATDLPVGYHVKVCGDIKSNAQIILTHEGVDGVTGSGRYTRLVVSGGAVTDVIEYNVGDNGLLWGSAPTSAAKVVSAGPSADAGEFFSWYGDNYNLYYRSATGTIVAKDLNTLDPITGDNSWGYNFNCMDAKSYNGAYYLTHLVTSHFPNWGFGPLLYLYDAATPSLIKSASPISSDTAIEWYQTGNYASAKGDVIISQSADGFRMFVYYYDFHAQVIGGYTMDCIKK